jgi:hypothetical protein
MLCGKYLTSSFAEHAIGHIQGGRNADGTAPLAHTVPFTRKPEARIHVAHVLALILHLCKDSLAPDDITPLAAKLMIQYTRSRRLGPVRFLADAINADPCILRTRASIHGIIRIFFQRRQQATAATWRAMLENAPPRRLLLSIPPFTLEEATDPRHLLQDTLALGHCVGYTYDEDILARQGITSRNHESLQYLSYWQSIKAKQTRIITLMEGTVPRVTVEYRMPYKTLGYIEGNVKGGRAVRIPDSYAKALSNLSRVLDLHKTQRVKLYRLARAATHPPILPDQDWTYGSVTCDSGHGNESPES